MDPLAQGCQTRFHCRPNQDLFALGEPGGCGLVIAANWVGVAGVGHGRDGRGRSLAISGTAPWDNSGPITGQIRPKAVCLTSALKDTNKVQEKF